MIDADHLECLSQAEDIVVHVEAEPQPLREWRTVVHAITKEDSAAELKVVACESNHDHRVVRLQPPVWILDDDGNKCDSVPIIAAPDSGLPWV